MADKPKTKDFLPSLASQNPSLVDRDSQDLQARLQTQVERIMGVFRQVLPSNYTSEVDGPEHSVKFRAAAEQIAKIQLESQEIFSDGLFDYTRPEFLFQILGVLVFPDGQSSGYPELEGDLTYREFLTKMVPLLLQGATKKSVEGGIKLLTDATVEVIERGIAARKLKGGNSAWGEDDLHVFEVNVSKIAQTLKWDDVHGADSASPKLEPEGETADILAEGDPTNLDIYRFPDKPFRLQRNVELVLKALKPAHTLYDYRNLFKDSFGRLFADAATFTIEPYYYDDARKFCWGAKNLTGTAGETLADTALLSDPTRDFASIVVGAKVTLTSGSNSTAASAADRGEFGHYRVKAKKSLLSGTDATKRAYTTSPTALSGKATVTDFVIEDTAQDWANAVEGETITFTEGPNIGTFRLKTVLGNGGGKVGFAAGPATKVKAAESILQLTPRMKQAATGQAYTVEVDRLGVQEAQTVADEDVSQYFFGPVAKKKLWTSRGPLVKGWGDGTLATKNDVVVEVDGVPVSVAKVNPYKGEVELTNTVAVTNPPKTVTVTYKWLASATVPFKSNTVGSNTNRWVIPAVRHFPSHRGETVQDANNPKGSGPTGTFPMNVVSGPTTTRWHPRLFSHRYMAIELAYSALSNSPLTLLSNQSPHRPSALQLDQVLAGTSASYEGTDAPTAASPAWAISGTDAGSQNPGEGTYTVEDNQSGSYTDGTETAVVYRRGVRLSFPSTVYVVGRFQIEDSAALLKATNTDVLVPDGVFTGVGFGVHDNTYLFMAGALLVNGVEHVGLCTNPARPWEEDSWSIGPTVQGTVKTTTTVEVATASAPVDVAADDRFQVLSGNQKGVYTISKVEHQSGGKTLLTLTTAFPADFTLFGNGYPNLVFETPWSGSPATYRLEVSPDTGTATLSLSGLTTATVVSFTGAPPLPHPGQGNLLLATAGEGQAFFGSLSRKATNRTSWSFFRYAVVPDSSRLTGREVRVTNEMSTLPQDDTAAWALLGAFGTSAISSGKLVLRNDTAHANLDFLYGLGRVEPHLSPKALLDLTTILSVDSTTSHGGEVVINDGEREVRLATLLYAENTGHATQWRHLITLPAMSASGLLPATSQGWTQHSWNDLTVEHRGATLKATSDADKTGAYQQLLGGAAVLTVPNSEFADQGSRIMEARFKVVSHTAVGGATNIRVSGQVGTGGTYRFVELRLLTGAVELRDAVGQVNSWNFTWDDGEFHTYRIVADVQGDTVSLWVDDTLQAPAQALAANFGAGQSGNTQCIWGQYGVTNAASVVEWEAVNYQVAAPTTAKRTLGIWLGGDRNNINNWELPRTDADAAINSDQTGPVIQAVNWTADQTIRLFRDPQWGVTMFLPAVGVPPFYAGEAGVGTGFASQTTEPSAGWINVEYDRLPIVEGDFGFVWFGALQKGDISQQRWDRITYRLYRHLTEDYKTKEGMTSNRVNVISSGDRGTDVTLEVVTVPTVTTEMVSLRPAHINAKHVYQILDGQTVFAADQWLFDSKQQTITLLPDKAGNARAFSGVGVDVTITFIPGGPVTETYLKAQPVGDGAVLLNEDTPPMPKSQLHARTKEIVYGASNVRDLSADVQGNTLTDPYRVIREKDDGGLFDANSSKFFEIKDAGQLGVLQIACDDILPAAGADGWKAAEGEKVYSPTGGGAALPNAGGHQSGLQETGGTVGQPVGSGFHLSGGSLFWERFPIPSEDVVICDNRFYSPDNGMLVSGGDFVGQDLNEDALMGP